MVQGPLEVVRIAGKNVYVMDERKDPAEFCRKIAEVKALTDNERALMLFDLDTVFDSLQLWKDELPDVKMFYAVKCNNNSVLLKVLAAAGASFDCASVSELKSVLSMGCGVDQMIYAHTVKSLSSIQFAKNHGIKYTTVDSAEELEKLAAICPNIG